jgi:hypothetical protein
MKTVTFEGMKVRIERPKGFVQKGVGPDGKPWERTYLYDYGFIPKTNGGDGEGIDVFLGPDEEEADDAHWVIQKKPDGSFDEYKVFLGFKSRAAAKKAYLQHIPRRFFGGMISMSVQMMRAMLGQEPAEKLATGLELSAIVL